jgi:hypothetical protein
LIGGSTRSIVSSGLRRRRTGSIASRVLAWIGRLLGDSIRIGGVFTRSASRGGGLIVVLVRHNKRDRDKKKSDTKSKESQHRAITEKRISALRKAIEERMF